MRGYGTTGKGLYINTPQTFFCPSGRWGEAGTRASIRYINSYYEKALSESAAGTYSYNTSGDPYLVVGQVRIGPYDSTAKGKLSQSVSAGYLCAADGYKFSTSGPVYSGVNHAGHDGLPEGFNVLFFDGSVKWVSNSQRNICNTSDNAHCLNTTAKTGCVLWTYRQNTLP